MDLFKRLFGGDDRPPAPSEADADDVAEYSQRWARSHPLQATNSDRRDPDPEASGYAEVAKQDADEVARNVKHRAEFPWLYNPNRGVRWDFDPIALRNLAQTDTWVGMLVQSITKEIAETPWTIVESEGRVETQKRLSTHPDERDPIAKADAAELPDATAETIYDLLQRPNPDDTWQDLVEQWMADFLEVGSMATVKVFHRSAYDGAGEELTADAETIQPRALQPTAPEVWTKDYHERTRLVNGYWQFDDHRAPGAGTTDSGATMSHRAGGSPDFFDAAELLWSDMSPRTNRRYGIPPTLLVEDFLRSIDLAVTQEQQYLSRGSIPSGAWVFENWDREQVKEKRQEMQENVSGKPHKSLMMAGEGGDVKFEPMSMNFQELEFTERMKWYARVVASAFQVPTAVVGIEPERINYSTFQGERENFESNTLGPYLQKLERIINHDLIHPHWGRGYRFEFKPGMSESTRKMISDRVRAEFNSNIRTRNEARQEIGLAEADEEGFKDEVVEDTDPTGSDPLDDLALAVDKANGAAVEYPNAGGPAFESRTTLIDFCEDLAEVCDGGVFVGDAEYPDEMGVDLDGQPVRAVGIGERKAYAVWSRYRDEAVALSDPHTIDSASDVVEQDSDGALDKEFAADVYRIIADDSHEMFDAGAVLGIGVDFPKSGVYVDWNVDEWPDEDKLSGPHVSEYDSIEDAQQVAQGTVEHVDTIDADVAEKFIDRDGGSGNVLEGWDGIGPYVEKDDPLRNTDDWGDFDVQPHMVQTLTDEIADDVQALYDEVLDDDEIRRIIDRLAVDDADATEKSLSAIGRRLREVIDSSEVVGRIRRALREETAQAARETVEETLRESAEVDVETDVDVEAIEAQLADREVQFADAFVDEMQDDILDTVGDGWAEGKGTREIADEIAEQADINSGWTGAERIARQELHVATGEARSEVAADLDRVEVWQTSGDDRVRPAHERMQGAWKRPGENWQVKYENNAVIEESVPGDSRRGIGCRCTTLLRDIETVDDSDHAGV